MIEFCPVCEQEAKIIKDIKTEDMNIRGVNIPVERTYFRCENCGEVFELTTNDYDPYDTAYREYRRRKGWVQPEEIKAFRENLGLTQQEFSELLGIGIATLNRYENGALQTEANNLIIRLCLDDPQILLRLVKHKSKPTTETDQNRLNETIRKLMENNEINSPKEDEVITGKINLHIPKSLHRRLLELAEDDNSNINEWIIATLAEAIGASTILDKRIEQTIHNKIDVYIRSHSKIPEPRQELHELFISQKIDNQERIPISLN